MKINSITFLALSTVALCIAVGVAVSRAQNAGNEPPASPEASAPALDGGLKHANGDPLRAADGPYDTRTVSGRNEIEWMEDRLETSLWAAMSDVSPKAIVVDVVMGSVVIVLYYSEELTDDLKKSITDTVVLFTDIKADRIRILKAPFD